MWLLNACTWELKEFITDKQAPPYAILSHTWRDGEVMFREWQKEPWEIVERKEGFAKINSCCQQAVADGLEWVWVDTCCIDKRSSAELSEAINSMYQWYKSAEVCYAYIDDVSDHIESNLANCRWVTRGWTLQELIAPREVVFYSKDWRFLSTRSELSANLAAVTGVQKRFLVGRSLSSASIAQRMSWAAKRTATREEDSAYCLLGIFDVNMPLLYGEGSKAFGRLQEILVREYPYDHSLFAWGKIVGQPSNLVDREPWPTYNPDEVAKPFYGLLANSPADFRDCGKIVRDTTADNLWRPAAVSTLVGSIAHVELPTVTTRYKMALHYQNAPIVQVMSISYILLLCGQQGGLHEAPRMAIPIIYDGTNASRTDEIVLFGKSPPAFNWLGQTTKCRIQSLPPPAPRNGDLVLRDVTLDLQSEFRYSPGVDLEPITLIFPMPRQVSGYLFGIFSKLDSKIQYAIVAYRLGALNHSHEDSTTATGCGRLMFALRPYIISLSREGASISIVKEQRDSGGPPAQKSYIPPVYSSQAEAESDLAFNTPFDYKHEMALPRDEWRISIIGLADIYISVERMFTGAYESGYDSDASDEDKDDMHRFVDVIDITVDDNDEVDTRVADILRDEGFL